MDRTFTKRNVQIYLTVICIITLLFLKKALNDYVKEHPEEEIEFFSTASSKEVENTDEFK